MSGVGEGGREETDLDTVECQHEPVGEYGAPDHWTDPHRLLLSCPGPDQQSGGEDDHSQLRGSISEREEGKEGRTWVMTSRYSGRPESA